MKFERMREVDVNLYGTERSKYQFFLFICNDT